MLYTKACIKGAMLKRADRILSVAIVAIITPAPAADLYIPKKPFLSVLT